MEDAINILIFVATIVIFIVSAIYKNKKGAQEGKQGFTESIESLFGLQENKPMETVSSTVDIKPNDALKAKKITADFEKKNSATIKEEKVDNYSIELEENQEDFDLRAAVIYSEIMNRKDY